MIAEYNARDLNLQFPLGYMFGSAATLSSLTAIASGLGGGAMMLLFRTTAAPFMLAAVCLITARVGLSIFWVC